MKYGNMTWGRMEAIVNKLGGEEGVKRFLSGELVVSAPVRVWKTWKTVKLGTGLKTADDFRKALKAGGYRISDWASDILGKRAFKASETEMELDLVRVSVAELGFKNEATLWEIYHRAQELGLELCPNEVGPQLRLQYQDQPNGEWVIVVMEPIAILDGGLRVFSVEHDDFGRWLIASCGDPDRVWHADRQFVFVRRK